LNILCAFLFISEQPRAYTSFHIFASRQKQTTATMKQASLHYFKMPPKRRRGRPLKNPVPLPIFAVLPKKTKATKEVRDKDTEDSGEEDGGAEKYVEVDEVCEVDEVDEVDDVDDEVADPKKKRPRINWRTPVHRETLVKAMQEGCLARDYMSVPRNTIIYYQDLMTATGKSIDELLFRC
jgi:hypothetical protein